MREVPQPLSHRTFEGEISRVTVRRVWKQEESGNGHGPRLTPQIVVHIEQGQQLPGRMIIGVVSVEEFSAIARDFAAVAGRVAETAREMLKNPGPSPAQP
jgi:hypothetical protein